MKIKLAATPYGRRKVHCDCTEAFDAHNSDTECFESGKHSAPCPVCHKYQWYHITATMGGNNTYVPVSQRRVAE